MSLARLSIRRPIAVAMLFLAVILLGLISFNRLPVDLLPDVAYPRLVIYTTEDGAAPAEVERFLSTPIEQVVASVPGVQRVESVSREALSLVIVEFAWGTDMDFAAVNVREKLDGLSDVLPELADRPAVLRMDPRSEPIMALSVSGLGSLPETKEMADQVFRRRLEQIDGVAQVAVTGGLEREIHVELMPQRMQSLGVQLSDVVQALESANVSAPGGTVRQGRYRYSLRTLGELRTVDEIARVPLGTVSRDSASSVAVLHIGDVATVSDGFEDRQSIARYGGGDVVEGTPRLATESVGMLVFKAAGTNTVRVAERVETTLDELRAQFPDARIEVAMSQASFVSEAIDNVVDNLIEGAVLAFLVLLLFLRDIRYPIAIALAIPISVVATFSLMDVFGVSLNIMSLGGLALGVGMLVDNSIVVLENTFRHRELGRDAEEAAALGAEEVQGAITAATLTTIAVFGPIVYIEGVAGELFGALSLAVAFSLLASIFVALTLLPMLAARWGGQVKTNYKPALDTGSTKASADPVIASAPTGSDTDVADLVGSPAAERADPDLATTDFFVQAGAGDGWRILAPFRALGRSFDRGFARFSRHYDRMLVWALDHRYRTIGLALALLLIAALVALKLDRRVLPVVDQGEFRARIELPRGTPLEETAAVAHRLEQTFLDDADVVAVFTSVGRATAVAGVEEDESGLNTARLEVRLREDASTAEVVERVRPHLESLPPGALSIESGEATAIGRLLGGGEADLAVRIRGEDLDGALEHASRVEARLSGVGAVTNVRMGTELGQPEMRVEIDRERAASYGVEPRRIADAITGYMKGSIATEFVDFDRKIPVVVRLPESERRSLSSLQDLRIDGVPLRELVQIRSTLGPAEIRREGQSRLVVVYADVASGGLDEAVAAVHQELSELTPPPGLRVEVGGENEQMRRSLEELLFAFTLALLLVYMILAAEFESFIHPLIILISVPLGLVGAFIALWVTGAGINTMSLIGLIVLAGLVDNNAVIKVDFINQMRKRGLPLREAIVAAGHARLRPILMTTITTMLGLLPMAIVGGRGAELRSPLAIAIFGGLFSATVLTLIIVPVVYDIVESTRIRVWSVVGKRESADVSEPIAAGD